jgi:hypothetical protein
VIAHSKDATELSKMGYSDLAQRSRAREFLALATLLRIKLHLTEKE